MTTEVFISHSHADAKLAAEFEALLEEVSNTFSVERSSKEGAIEYGTNWIDWIYQRVDSADVTFVLLTPGSFAAEWVLWEAGAVFGARRAQGGKDPPIPVEYNLPSGRDRGPFQGVQTIDGLDVGKMADLVRKLLRSLLDKGEIGSSPAEKTRDRAEQICDDYVTRARKALEQTQVARSEDRLQEWISRLDHEFDRDNYAFARPAARWINIAFLGPAKADERAPIDFRIHMRLAEGFLALGDSAQAKTQLELARGLSPRDMMILRKLGQVELDLAQTDAARQWCDKMTELDEQVFVNDEEALMLSVRIHIEKGEEQRALDALNAAPIVARSSTYGLNMLAILTLLLEGPSEKAAGYFRDLRELEAKHLGRSMWTLGNLVNAALGLGEAEPAVELLTELANNRDAMEKRASISRYFDRVIAAREDFSFDWRRHWPDR